LFIGASLSRPRPSAENRFACRLRQWNPLIRWRQRGAQIRRPCPRLLSL